MMFLLLASPATHSRHSPQWIDREGAPLPFTNDAEVEDFLSTAKIVASKELEGTRNQPLKLTLSKDGVEARAIFRTVDKKRSLARVGNVEIRDYHDSYIYECAAYELSRLLDLDYVPPCILRTIDGKKGASLAVPVTGAEHDRIGTEHNTGVLFRILTGFPPRYFLRLDPR